MKKIIMGVLALSALAACNSENDVIQPVNNAGVEMRFGSSIGTVSGSTRAIDETSTTFTDGDLIDIVGYHTQTGEVTAYGTPFMKDAFVWDGTDKKFTLDPNSDSYTTGGSDGPGSYPDDYKWVHTNNDYYFYAYYPIHNASDPYGMNRNNASINLPVLTATTEGTTEGLEDEILWAKSGKVESVDWSVQTPDPMSMPSLSFKRKVAKIRFRVQFDRDITGLPVSASDYEVQNISFNASNQAATMNLFTGVVQVGTKNCTFTLDSDASGITIEDNMAAPQKNATDYNSLDFAPMLYAGAGVSLTDLKVKINGNELTVNMGTDGAGFVVEQGKITYVLLTLKPTVAGPEIEFQSTIEAWGSVEAGTGVIG